MQGRRANETYSTKGGYDLTLKYATIKANNMILFDGESVEVPVSRYLRLSTYTPVAGDRVVFIVDGTTNILIGKVVK